MKFFGSGDVVTPSTAAYVAFKDVFPADLTFGWARESFGIPGEWWPLQIR